MSREHPVDICEVCHKSAYVNEGKQATRPNPDPETSGMYPTLWSFTCAACVNPKPRLTLVSSRELTEGE